MARRVPTDLTMLARLYAIWEPQEDARRQISEDLKELFAEAKGNGYNPKALRKAFAERYRLDHQTDEQALKTNQTDEDTELYLSAPARVRESDAEDDTQTRLNSVRTRILVTAANNGPPEQDEHESTAVDLDGMGDQDAPAHPVDTNSTENVGASAGRLHSDDCEVPTGSPAGVSVDTSNILHMPAPKPQFVQVPFEGAINQ